MSKINLDGMKAVLSSIQGGSWSYDPKDGNVWCEKDSGDSCIIARIVEDGERWATDNPIANGAFIAIAPKMIVELITEVERLQAK